MIKLPVDFKKYGNLYHQIKREKHKALYSVIQGDRIEGFEVIRVKVSPATEFTLSGNTVKLKEKELYPTAEQFGKMGWFYMEKANAEAKYESLQPREQK